MSPDWTYLLLLLPAERLVREDFRSREVAVGWLIVLGVVGAAVGGIEAGWRSMMSQAAVNVCLLALLGCATAGWHFVRRGSLRDFFTGSLGAGDMVMLLMLIPLFSPEAYVRFLLAACLAALGWWYIKRPASLPLAGFMALTLIGYAILKTAGAWS